MPTTPTDELIEYILSHPSMNRIVAENELNKNRDAGTFRQLDNALLEEFMMGRETQPQAPPPSMADFKRLNDNFPQAERFETLPETTAPFAEDISPATQDVVGAIINQGQPEQAPLPQQAQPEPTQQQRPQAEQPLPEASALPTDMGQSIIPIPQLEKPTVPEKESTVEEISREVKAAAQGKPSSQALVSSNRLETNVPIQINKSNKPPNPIEMEYLNNIGYAKMLYESAPKDASGDAQRATAEKIAATVRQLAEASGIDISRFGALTANAEDVYKSIYAQRGYDLMNAFQGEYHKSANEVYEDAYQAHLLSGRSSATAHRFAQQQAREYQAKRVAYLDSLYNAYGKDNIYGRNDIGRSILRMMAQENPSYADFLARDDPNADKTYREMDKDARTQANQMTALTYGLDADLAKILTSGNIQDILNQNSTLREMNRDQFKSNLEVKEYAAKIVEDMKLEQVKASVLQKINAKPNEKSAVEQYFNEAAMIGAMSGLNEDEIQKFATEETLRWYANGGLNRGGSTGNKTTAQPKLSATQEALDNKLQNLWETAFHSNNQQDIEAFERAILDGTELDGSQSEGALSLPPERYKTYKDALYALKGFQRKMLNDDDGATAFWSQVESPYVLDQLYPNYNFDWYYERRGLTPPSKQKKEEPKK